MHSWALWYPGSWAVIFCLTGKTEKFCSAICVFKAASESAYLWLVKVHTRGNFDSFFHEKVIHGIVLKTHKTTDNNHCHLSGRLKNNLSPFMCSESERRHTRKRTEETWTPLLLCWSLHCMNISDSKWHKPPINKQACQQKDSLTEWITQCGSWLQLPLLWSAFYL